MPAEFKHLAPIVFILILATLPCLMGCSVLGIATSNDLETVQVNQSTQSRRTAAQIQIIEQELTRLDSLQTQLDQLEATTLRLRELESLTRGDVDSLMTEFRRATDELEAMGLGTLSDDLALARRNSQLAVQNYLARLKAEHEALGFEIQELEAMSQAAPETQIPDSDEPLEDLGGSGQ